MFAPELGTQAFSGYRAFALSYETPSLEKIFIICTKVTSIQHKIDEKNCLVQYLHQSWALRLFQAIALSRFPLKPHLWKKYLAFAQKSQAFSIRLI